MDVIKKKSPKIWAAIIIVVILGIASSVLSYALKHTSSTKTVLNVINNNDRILQFLGAPIETNSIAQENIRTFYDKNGLVKSEVKLKLTGVQKAANIMATVWRQKEGSAVVDLSIDANGSKQDFIDLSLRTNVFNNEEIARKGELANFPEILNRVVKEGGYFILMRSRKNNDYMQVGNMKNQEGACLFLEYSEGFNTENKKIYRAEGNCLNQNNVLKLLYSYALGNDTFKKEMKWKQLKKIETDSNGAEQFIF